MAYNCHNFCNGQVLDAQTMNEIEQGILDLEKKATITGKGAPTNKTEGNVGRLYMNTDTGALYKCTAVANGVYTWAPGESGGGGYTPVRGVDYWTPDDIAEIKTYVDEAILGGAW